MNRSSFASDTSSTSSMNARTSLTFFSSSNPVVSKAKGANLIGTASLAGVAWRSLKIVEWPAGIPSPTLVLADAYSDAL
jgi:hypothetical protein